MKGRTEVANRQALPTFDHSATIFGKEGYGLETGKVSHSGPKTGWKSRTFKDEKIRSRALSFGDF